MPLLQFSSSIFFPERIVLYHSYNSRLYELCLVECISEVAYGWLGIHAPQIEVNPFAYVIADQIKQCQTVQAQELVW